jgi:hypothetical protein
MARVVVVLDDLYGLPVTSGGVGVLCVCAIQRVNRQDKRFKCLWNGYVSGAPAWVCEALQHCLVFHVQQFTVYEEWSTTQRTHPSNLTELWVALESTWASIPVERFWHLVESMAQCFEAGLSGKKWCNSIFEGVPNVFYTQCIYTVEIFWKIKYRNITPLSKYSWSQKFTYTLAKYI